MPRGWRATGNSACYALKGRHLVAMAPGKSVPEAMHGVGQVSLAEKMVTRGLNVYFGSTHVLHDVSMPMAEHEVTALMGPHESGKSTFIRALNRMHDETPGTRVTGSVMLDGQDIYGPKVDVLQLRQRVGMVFRTPTLFPVSIFDNVAYGLKLQGHHSRIEIQALVECSLRNASLWDEVKDSLKKSGFILSRGQQQRLCIARALAVGPEVIVMDEPCSTLDPAASFDLEELMSRLKQWYTIVLATHSLSQAARVSQYVGFFLAGKLIEFGQTGHTFSQPCDRRTEDYITGRFG